MFRVGAVNVEQTGINVAEMVEIYVDFLEFTMMGVCKVEVI